MQESNKKAAPFSLHWCVFYLSSLNFPVDSPNSNFHFFPRCYVGHSATIGAPSGKRGDWG